MSAAVTRIVDLITSAPARTGRPRVLAIDGRSGSGKTTMADDVRSVLEASPEPSGAPLRPSIGAVPVVHLENFYPGWDGLAASIPLLADWLLKPLAEGRPAGYRRFDWVASEFAEWVDVPAAPIVIVEGAGAGGLDGAGYLSVLVWMDAPAELRFERAIGRDGDTYRPHWERWAEQEVRYVAEHDPRGRADLRLDTQDSGVT